MSEEKMKRIIMVNEDQLWNTLHPEGYAKFLEQYCKLLGEEGDATYWLAKLETVIDILNETYIDARSWGDFRRRNPAIIAKEGAKDE